jgi:hypothetical protein
MVAGARQLSRALVGVYRERVAHHVGDGAFRTVADEVDAAVVAHLDGEDADSLRWLRRATHAASLGKGEAIMAGAPSSEGKAAAADGGRDPRRRDHTTRRPPQGHAALHGSSERRAPGDDARCRQCAAMNSDRGA